jgi:hypothetical protein
MLVAVMELWGYGVYRFRVKGWRRAQGSGRRAQGKIYFKDLRKLVIFLLKIISLEYIVVLSN